MVAYAFYELDNRIRRYAEALVQRGDTVDVIALRRESQPPKGVLNGVQILRVQQRVKDEKSKFVYLVRLLLFFFRSMLLLTRMQMKRRYDVIHVHSIPDFEVFAALYPKLTGSKIILDIHDIVPEFYASKFGASQRGLVFRLLVAVERMAASFSDHVIVANHIWQERLLRRSVSRSKCTTFLNYPDTNIFRRQGKKRSGEKFVILYPGSVTYHQGVDIAVRAFARIKSQVPRSEFHIYGIGDQLDSLKCLIKDLGMQNVILLKDILPLHEIGSVIENADLGVVPKRKSGFGNEAFSTKILEFMTLGVPVIVSDTLIDRYYFNDSVVRFFRAGDELSLADTILQTIRSVELRRQLASSASEFVKAYTWEANKGEYFNLVDSLTGVHIANGPTFGGKDLTLDDLNIVPGPCLTRTEL